MKKKVLTSLIVLALLLVAINISAVFAQAFDTAFTTSITYQNVGPSATTQLEVWFYDSPTDTSPTIISRPNLNPGASTSLFIGGLTEISQGFRGTAIMVSDQPLLATLVQLPQNSTTVKNRPLSNGFTSGSEDTLIATVVKDFFGGSQYTIFSVQNVGSSATTVDIKFYEKGSSTPKHTITQSLEPGAGTFVDTFTVPEIGAQFNGSVVVESTGGSIISSAMELQRYGTGARAFEGLGVGEMKFYMPSALCAFGAKSQTTNFAVQNTSLTTSTNATITYYNLDGTVAASETKALLAGSKQSFLACEKVSNGFKGSATVTSDSQPIIAMGKAGGGGLFTAYVGFGSGDSKIALPYVRWTTGPNYYNGSKQLTYIAIQNIGSTDIPLNQITVEYIDRDGNVVGTDNLGDNIPGETMLKPGGKVNSHAGLAGLVEFGYYNPGAGGGAIITGPGGSELVAIARVQSYVPATLEDVGEDYNAMPVP